MVVIRLIRWFAHGDNRPQRVGRALAGALILNLLFGLAFYLAERSSQEDLSLVDSIWWAMVTMTTVGYGDLYPVTSIGRFLIAYPCFLLGIGLIGYLLGTLADAVLEHFNRKRKGTMTTSERDHFIIINCPSVPRIQKIATELRAVDQHSATPVTVVTDALDERPGGFEKDGIVFVKGDPTLPETLERASVGHARAVIVVPATDDPATDTHSHAVACLADNLTENNESRPRIVALLRQSESAQLFEHSGLGYVVANNVPDYLLIQETVQPGVARAVGQLLSYTFGSELYVVDHPFGGKTIQEIRRQALDQDLNVQIIGLAHDGKHDLSPSNRTRVSGGDRLVVLAPCLDDYQRLCEGAARNE
ncbi:MAG: ion channel [Verrucomicrobiota bacterium]